MLRAALTLLLAAAAPAAGDNASPIAPSWHVKTSPHFEIYHESSWSPASISLEMERMYSSMRMSMAMFAPWMVKERAKIYIYSSQQSYLSGEFNPPKWSKGLAYFSKKTVVVYDTGDISKLKAVIAHELSHLYFEGYFGEKLKYPPQWLNEGLAVSLEESVTPEGGAWSRALAYFPEARRYQFPKFFETRIEDLDSEARIADWYLQAYGTVLFLYKPTSRIQFKGFCEALREGENVNAALWKVYRIGDGDFGRKWGMWLTEYSRGEQAGEGKLQRSASFNFRPLQLSTFTFTNFGSKK